MSFKVLLIKPNILVRKGYALQSKMCPPIGLAYLAGSLIAAGFEAEILDVVAEAPDSIWPYRETHSAYGMTDDDLIRRIRNSNPQLIGIGGFTSQFGRIKEMVSSIKQSFPGIPVVLGGANATALPDYNLEKTAADYIVQGEGESAIVALAKGLQSKDATAIKSIDGLGYRNGNNIKVNPKTSFAEDLDMISWPARELLNHERYIEDGVAMPVITSRACPCRCTFCSAHLISGKKWHGRDPINVVDEIEDFVSKWHYETISIFDDAANVLPERLIAICKEVVRRDLGVRLTFPSSLILKYINKDLLYWMKRAGAVGLSLPIEHSNEVLRNKVINKGLDLKHVDLVLGWCRELKLLTLGNLVIGMPGETEATLQELLEYVKKTAPKMDMISAYVATPFPGTVFYDQCIKDGYLSDPAKNDFIDFDTYTMHIATSEMPLETLLSYKSKIENVFLEICGPDYPSDELRKIFRKPVEKGIEYLNKVYFK